MSTDTLIEATNDSLCIRGLKGSMYSEWSRGSMDPLGLPNQIEILNQQVLKCKPSALMSAHAPQVPRCKRSIRSEELQLYQAKKLIIYFMKTTNVLVVLLEPLLNIRTLFLKKNPSLSLLFIKSLSGTVEGGDGKQIIPQLLNKTFSSKSTRCKCSKSHKEPYNATLSTSKQCT